MDSILPSNKWKANYKEKSRFSVIDFSTSDTFGGYCFLLGTIDWSLSSPPPFCWLLLWLLSPKPSAAGNCSDQRFLPWYSSHAKSLWRSGREAAGFGQDDSPLSSKRLLGLISPIILLLQILWVTWILLHNESIYLYTLIRGLPNISVGTFTFIEKVLNVLNN